MLRLAFSRKMVRVVDNLGLPEEDKKKIDKIIQALKVNVEDTVNETVERKTLESGINIPKNRSTTFLLRCGI